MEYSSVDMAIKALKRDPAMITQAQKGIVIGVYREAEGYMFKPTRHMVNPRTRLNQWQALTNKEACLLFNELMAAACFLARAEAWHVITVTGGTPWLKQVEAQLSMYFTSQQRIDHLKKQYELMEARLTMDYSPRCGKRTQRATSNTEDFTTERASIAREIKDMERTRNQTEAAIKKLSAQQEEVLTRYYRNGESLRSVARSMRLLIPEVQRQGYEALKIMAACL